MIFVGEARFRGASFAGPTRFDGACFQDEALFGGTRGGEPDGASFTGEVTFTNVRFRQPPVFEHVQADPPIVESVERGWGQRR